MEKSSLSLVNVIRWASDAQTDLSTNNGIVKVFTSIWFTD